jgi:5-methylcytosine-specific restriction endonuclease McrBC regulatory subunit McrC
MITIDDKTGNPITEHKVNILDRLNPNMDIDRGLGNQVMIMNTKYKV